jgi:hypothetical protein
MSGRTSSSSSTRRIVSAPASKPTFPFVGAIFASAGVLTRGK